MTLLSKAIWTSILMSTKWKLSVPTQQRDSDSTMRLPTLRFTLEELCCPTSQVHWLVSVLRRKLAKWMFCAKCHRPAADEERALSIPSLVFFFSVKRCGRRGWQLLDWIWSPQSSQSTSITWGCFKSLILPRPHLKWTQSNAVWLNVTSDLYLALPRWIHSTTKIEN